jgi:ABC-2 type transport system permease protein
MIDWQAVYVIWLREMKRFFRDRSQIIIGCVRPITWLFFMGYGLGASVRHPQGANYTQFMLPGILIMTLLFTAIQSSISIIWDREFGFLKEMLVAPISRTSIVLGKACGGATLSVIEALIVMILGPMIGVHFGFVQVIVGIGEMILIGFSLSALGITIASRMKSFEGFGAVMNFIVMPLFLLSGALFPLEGLPFWLSVLVRLNPLSYGVDLLRGTLLHLNHNGASLNLTVISVFTVLMISSAVWQFNRTDS